MAELEKVNDEYRSIEAPSEGLFKDNGSRFIALAYPVETEGQVKEIVSSLKKEYHDARHHCYAYRLGYRADVFRANDDGEPSGSAGRPILGQIDSLGLSDVLVVVVRYFGGIKLGIPGLIRAYRSSTSDALSSARIITRTASRRFRLEYPYEQRDEGRQGTCNGQYATGFRPGMLSGSESETQPCRGLSAPLPGHSGMQGAGIMIFLPTFENVSV